MENVLKALDPTAGTSGNFNSATGNSFLNGLNLDSSFTSNKKGSTGYNAGYTAGHAAGYNSGYTNNTTTAAANNNNYASNFDYFKPTNRSNIIKSHAAQKANTVSFKQPPTSQFFSSPDESFVNMTLPAMDTSLIFSDNAKKRGVAAVPSFKDAQKDGQLSKEKEQFINFAVQQYRMLASMNPEMLRSPENIEELADRETFKYWAKLFVEERERQARIVLNMQKALIEALSGSAAKGPNVLGHLGAATDDFELETIGRFADQCRKKSQMISQYFNNKQ